MGGGAFGAGSRALADAHAAQPRSLSLSLGPNGLLGPQQPPADLASTMSETVVPRGLEWAAASEDDRGLHRIAVCRDGVTA
jgi:hypothetical protein